MSTVLVTGANRGIGLSLVKHLVARGDTVVATSRRGSPELAALGVRVETVDVADDASVAALDARLGALQLDREVRVKGKAGMGETHRRFVQEAGAGDVETLLGACEELYAQCDDVARFVAGEGSAKGAGPR